MGISKGFKALGSAIVPILIFSQTAMAAPSIITYQNAVGQNIQVNYLFALTHDPMKTALINALSSSELDNLPIFVTDDNGSVINYISAISKSENYAVALTDSSVNHATVPVATYQMNADGAVTPVVTLTQVGTDPVNLGTAGNYAILSKAGISTVPPSVITGDIGVSPAAATYITGFSLTADATNVFSTSPQITGKAYASNYASTTPSNLTTAISNMEIAYVDAAERTANYIELYTGDISGQTLTPGVYKWGTGVLITSDVTLHGGPNDVWIFQIAKGITQANGTRITLTGGAQAKNIFWQSAETVSIGTGAHFEGNILAMTKITSGTNSSIHGRLLAQTAVTLDATTVVVP